MHWSKSYAETHLESGVWTGKWKYRLCCRLRYIIEPVYTHLIQFDNLSEPVCINRESCRFEVLKSIFYTRKQFPIMLAFSITVHKAQGLSLNTAIVDAGPASFDCGMTYVSLSRVTKINGLHLTDFDRTKIVCDHHAIDYDLRTRAQKFPLGSWVRVYVPRRKADHYQKWQNSYQGPFLVIRQLGPVNYEVQRSLQSKPWIVHVDKLKACHSSEKEAWLSGDAATATSKQPTPLPPITPFPCVPTELYEFRPASATRMNKFVCVV